MAKPKVGGRVVSTYTSVDAAWWPYVFIFLAAALPTTIWRWSGVILVGNLDETSEVIVLVRRISTALGETLEGDPVDKVVMLPVGPVADDGVTRIVESAGMELVERDGRLIVDQLTFGGAAEKQKIDFDWEIKSVQVEAERPAKQWFFIPAILLLLLIWKRQTSRAVREAVV